MKVSKENLKKILNESIVGDGLSNILHLKSDGSKLTVIGTNSICFSEVTVECEGEIDTKTYCNEFLRIINVLGEEIELIDGEKITVKSGSTKVKIGKTVAEDRSFPEVRGEEFELGDISKEIEIAFRSKNWNGVFDTVYFDKGHIVSTNTNRVFIAPVNCPDFHIFGNHAPLIKSFEKVVVGTSLMFTKDGVRIVIPRKDAKLPPYDKFKCDVEPIVFSRKDLIRVINVCELSFGKNSAVVMESKDGIATFKSFDDSSGAEDSLECEREVKFAFNGKWIRSFLLQCTDEYVNIHIDDPLKPFKFVCDGMEYFCAPVKI